MLHRITDEIEKANSFTAVDETDPEKWSQKQAVLPPSLDDQYPDLENVNSAPIVELLMRLRKVAGKKLAVLVVVDEAQYLDILIKPDAGSAGGARLALRVLRMLQKDVLNATKGEVLVLPMTTGINAEVSLNLGQTEGSNVIVGAHGDESLMSFDDFCRLTKEGSCIIRSMDMDFKAQGLAAAYYPLVRRMVRNTKLSATAMMNPEELDVAVGDMSIDTKGKTETLVLAAFTHKEIQRSDVAVADVATRAGRTLNTVIPVLSFVFWYHVHEGLLNERRNPAKMKGKGGAELCCMPFTAVNKFVPEVANRCMTFETLMFKVLGYFMSTFCGMDEFKVKDFWRYLESSSTGPLKTWLPKHQFYVPECRVLSNEMRQLNPFKHHKNDTPLEEKELSDEFVGLLCDAAAKALKYETPFGVWVLNGGRAPIDYILAVVQMEHGKLRLSLRFADAKHTTLDESGTAANRRLQRLMTDKAKEVHEGIAAALKKVSALTPYTPITVDAFQDTDMMICHNKPEESFLSPTTFEWDPWTRFLWMSHRREDNGSEDDQEVRSNSAE